MSTGVKRAILLAIVTFGLGFQAYLSYGAGKVLAPAIVEYNKAHPLNWVDVGLGAFAGALVVALLFIVISLFEANRFERQMGGPGDPTGSGGGGLAKRSKVRMPMSRKVIDIRDWNPPPGQMHMSPSAI